jgi:hypothetical protein
LAEAGERNVTELGSIRAAIRSWTVVRPNATYRPLIEKIEKDEEFKRMMGLILKEAGTGIARAGARGSEPPRRLEPLLRAVAALAPDGRRR